MRAILTYHSIDSSGSPVSTDPATFRRHVDWLANGHLELVEVGELLEMPDDADAAAITFDDGYRNFRTEAWPLLRDRRLPVTLFVVAGRVGGDNRWNDRPDEEDVPELDLLGWDDLGLLAEGGVTLASHGLTHAALTSLPRDHVREELFESRRLLWDRTGADPRGFAYPYGEADAFSREVAAALYDWACTTELAPLGERVAEYALPRLDMYYFRRPGSLERWGSPAFLGRLRLRRSGRRLRSWLSRLGSGVGREDREGRRTGGHRHPYSNRRYPDAELPGEGDRSGDGTVPEDPEISVIVPAHRDAENLHLSLPALLSSDLDRERWELIVANDGSDPETEAVARRYADRVVVLEGKPRGPGYARNRGARIARGDILVFVDSDVRVHRDTLSGFQKVLSDEADVAAVFGSYDDRPAAPGVVSTYRNLLHHHVHQQNAGDAETFWAGCGALRKDVFEDLGGYDEWHFSRPQIEDIELGRRIRLRGHRILLRPEIQATHLKRWSLLGVLKTDLMSRGIPWTRLVLHEGDSQGRQALNLSPRHRLCVVLAGLAGAGGTAALVFGWSWAAAGAAASALGVVAVNIDFYALLGRRKSWVCALCSVPLHFLHYLSNGFSAVAGWIAFVTVGAPLPPVDAAAFREAGMDAAEPLPSPPSESVWYRYDD